MPLIPEPPMPTKCTCWYFLNTAAPPLRRAEQQVGDARRGVGPAEPARRRLHRGDRARDRRRAPRAPPPARRPRGRCSSSMRAAPAAASARAFVRWWSSAARGEGHQQRGLAGDRQLGAGGGARCARARGRPSAKRRSMSSRNGDHLGLAPGGAVRGRDRVAHRGPGLVHDAQPRRPAAAAAGRRRSASLRTREPWLPPKASSVSGSRVGLRRRARRSRRAPGCP